MQRDLPADASPVAPASPGPQPPPRSEIGIIGWMRHNLFSSWGNSLLTVIAIYVLYRLIVGVVDWAFINAVWTGDSGEACKVEGSGACWAFIRAKFGQFIYGRYPDAERWRVNLVFAMAVAGLLPLMVPQIPGKFLSAVYTLFIFPVIAFWLLTGSGGSGAGIVDAVGLVLAVGGVIALLLSRRGASQTLKLAGVLSLVVAYP